MSHCIESIKLLDGKMPLLKWHERRFQETSRKLFGTKKRRNMAYHLAKVSFPQIGLFKVRVVYDKSQVLITFLPYQLANHKKVEFRIDNELNYKFKLEDRIRLNQHKESCTADDFIIIQNGFLTDAWYSNIALLKNGRWFTPKSYLLNGVKRQALIASGVLKEIVIAAKEISNFEQIAFINAMRDFEKRYTFRQEGNLLYLKKVPQ
jgi:4-amino-4-deoxychorismate lyase